jgi:hypothetical protein
MRIYLASMMISATTHEARQHCVYAMRKKGKAIHIRCILTHHATRKVCHLYLHWMHTYSYFAFSFIWTIHSSFFLNLLHLFFKNQTFLACSFRSIEPRCHSVCKRNLDVLTSPCFFYLKHPLPLYRQPFKHHIFSTYNSLSSHHLHHL